MVKQSFQTEGRRAIRQQEPQMDKMDTQELIPILFRPRVSYPQFVLRLGGGGVRARLPTTDKYCAIYGGCQLNE